MPVSGSGEDVEGEVLDDKCCCCIPINVGLWLFTVYLLLQSFANIVELFWSMSYKSPYMHHATNYYILLTIQFVFGIASGQIALYRTCDDSSEGTANLWLAYALSIISMAFAIGASFFTVQSHHFRSRS